MEDSAIIKTVFGEKSVNRGRRRVYFFFYKNCQLVKVKECDHIRMTKFNQLIKDIKGNRSIEAQYTCLNGIDMMVKMVILGSDFGKPNLKDEIFINICKGLPKIRLIGPEGFGLYEGIGQIDFDNTKLSSDYLKANYSYEVLSPPTVNSKKIIKKPKGRALLF